MSLRPSGRAVAMQQDDEPEWQEEPTSPGTPRAKLRSINMEEQDKPVAMKLAEVLSAFAARLRAGEHEQELLDAVAMELEEKARELLKAPGQ